MVNTAFDIRPNTVQALYGIYIIIIKYYIFVKKIYKKHSKCVYMDFGFLYKWKSFNRNGRLVGFGDWGLAIGRRIYGSYFI